MNYNYLLVSFKILLVISWIGSITSVSYLLGMNVPDKTNTEVIIVSSLVFIFQFGLTVSSLLYPVVFRLHHRQTTFKRYEPVISGTTESLLSPLDAPESRYMS